MTTPSSLAICRAFRFYRDRYATQHVLDRPLARPALILVRLVLILAAAGPSWLLRKVLTRYVAQRLQGLADTPILAIALSRNQRVVWEFLCDLGVDVPLLTIGVKSRGGAVSRMSNGLLVLGALADRKATLSILRESGNDPILRSNGVRLIKLSGLRWIFDQVLREARPRVLLCFNDHEPYTVLCTDLARARHIPTAYMQHAPVNGSFPRLYHALNILFSPQAEECYQVRESDAEWVTLFDVRMLPAAGMTERPTSNHVLICTGLLDSMSAVQEVVQVLLPAFRVRIRPHPRDRRRWRIRGAELLPADRPIWPDIADAAIVVGNESAVALEAIVAGRPYYKCSFFSESRDMYGFMAKGLITKEYANASALVRDIRQGDDPIDRSKLDWFVGPVRNAEERARNLAEMNVRLSSLGPTDNNGITDA